MGQVLEPCIDIYINGLLLLHHYLVMRPLQSFF